MQRAFIVKLELDPSEDPTPIAGEILAALSDTFGDVLIGVEPWNQHDSSTSSTLAPPPMAFPPM